MKFKNFNYFIIITYLISSSIAYSIDLPNVKNLIIHNKKKKIEYVEFLNSESKKVSLNDFKSDIVIINFWATWCAPCKKEMPSLNRLKSIDKFNNIAIIPINIGDEGYKKSKDFFEKLNIDRLEIFSGSSRELSKKFKIRGIPTTILLDKEGYEFARIIGLIDFENKYFLNFLNNNL